MGELSPSGYVLGHGQDELDRLDQQGRMLGEATRTMLTLAGVGARMTLLDTGTGTGPVAAIGAELVGESGSVIGVDRQGRRYRRGW